tara:strand:+ start:1334 stop:1669 length:336 start_codon:yes stop_codon:yes gene_type:complete
MSDKKELTVNEVLTEIDKVRKEMITLHHNISLHHMSESISGDNLITRFDEVIHEKWLDTLPSFLLERFSIPKKEFNSKRYAEEQANKMFKEDIINDHIGDLASDYDEDFPI